MLSNSILRKYLYFAAVKDIVQLFGEQEVGSCEVNDLAVANYVESFEFSIEMMLSETEVDKEAIYQKVTDDILKGYPIWRLLDVPKWTLNMLERSLNQQVIEERQRLERTYKCYTCKYFIEDDTSIGTIEDCNWEKAHRDPNKRYFDLGRPYGEFVVKKRCKKWEPKE